MRLKDKVAIITGSSRGIGKAVALAFAEEGADVVVNYVKNMQLADGVISQIKAIDRRALAIQADVSDINQVEKMVQKTIDEFGRIDILVNNAGIFGNSTVRKMEKELQTAFKPENTSGVPDSVSRELIMD